MKVLDIQLYSFKDLIRLAVSIKREHVSIISYPYKKRYIAGLYLPSFTKELSALFPYVILKEKPSSVYSYTSSDHSGEDLKVGVTKSSIYIPIFVAFLKRKPHEIVRVNELKYEIVVNELEDLKSLIYLSLSLTDSWTHIPFVWYDTISKRFVLSIEVGPREDIVGELLVLTLPYEELDINNIHFIIYDQSQDFIEFSSGFKGVNYQYISIIKTLKLPYY